MFLEIREQYFHHVLGEEIEIYWNAVDQSDGNIKSLYLIVFSKSLLKCYPKIVSDGIYESSDIFLFSPQRSYILNVTCIICKDYFCSLVSQAMPYVFSFSWAFSGYWSTEPKLLRNLTQASL